MSAEDELSKFMSTDILNPHFKPTPSLVEVLVEQNKRLLDILETVVTLSLKK